MAARHGSDLSSRLGKHIEGEVRAGEPMAPKTTIRVGGPAELFVRPKDPDALVRLLAMARTEGVPVHPLGGGANTLVGDLGIPGVVVKLPADWLPDEVEAGASWTTVTLGGGAPITRVLQQMKSRRLIGAEFLAGIPGTVGGVLAMNAGTRAGECVSAVVAVEVATEKGTGWISRARLAASYRRTELPDGAVVTRVKFLLREGDVEASRAAMDADLAYRKRTQPLTLPSFGSVFKNPPGDHAGRLIEQVGLKGHVLGGAQISELHANWIVNRGGATARDVVGLIELAQQRVREATGVELLPEVRRVGRFEPTR